MLIVFFLSLSSERENNAKIIFNFSMDSWKDRFILFFFKYAVYIYTYTSYTRKRFRDSRGTILLFFFSFFKWERLGKR